MDKKRLVSIIDGLAIISIALVFFLVPVYFSAFYKDFSGFIIGKSAIFRILVELLAVLTVIRVFFAGWPVFMLKKYVYITVISFFTAFAVSTVFSLDHSLSFWGTYWRQAGLFTYLHFAFFFLLIPVYFDNRKKIEWLIDVMIAAGVIAAGYGIYQWLGYDFVKWQTAPVFGGRPGSTIGQPLLLANYLLLVAWFPVYKALSGSIWRRLIYILAFIIILFGLLLTFSRGAILGYLAGAWLGLIMILYLKRRKKTVLMIFILSFFLLGIGYFSLHYLSDRHYKNIYAEYISQRIINAFDLSTGSMAMRLEYWRAASDALKGRWLIGYGPEMQKDILARYYNPTWAELESASGVPDRFHNEFVDTTVSGGVILLASYLAVLFIFFARVLLHFRSGINGRKDYLVIFWLVSFCGYLAALLFGFSTIETNVYFWGGLALVFAAINDKENTENKKPVVAGSYFRYTYGILALFVFAISGYFLFLNIRIWQADYHFRWGKLSFINKDYSGMLGEYGRALELNPNESFYKYFLIEDTLASLGGVQSEDYRREVLAYIGGLPEILPPDSEISLPAGRESLYSSARYYAAVGAYQDRSAFQTSEKMYKKLLDFNRFYPNTYRSMAEMYLMAGEWQRAADTLNDLLAVLPDQHLLNPASNHYREVAEYKKNVYFNLGIVYEQLGELYSAADAYRKVIDFDPFAVSVYKNIATVYEKIGLPDEALKYEKRYRDLTEVKR